MHKKKHTEILFHCIWEEVRDVIERIISKLDAELFLFGFYAEKHYFDNKRTRVSRSQHASGQNMYCTAMEIHSQAEQYSADETDVIRHPIRKDDVEAKQHVWTDDQLNDPFLLSM